MNGTAENPTPLPAVLGIAAVFAAFGAVHLFNAAPSVTVGDSGEFITAASTLSLPHAPSYPLYTFAGRALLELFRWGGPAYRLNVFSALLNLVAMGLIFRVSRRWGMSVAGALLNAALAGASLAFFHHGLVTEVFALNTALALAVLAAVQGGTPRALVLGAFLGGLAMGNHQTVALCAPGFLAVWFAAARRSPGALAPKALARAVGLAALFFLLGLSVYGFLLFRARRGPPLDWGHPAQPAALARTFLRKDYGSFSLALGERPARTVSNGVRQLRRFAEGYGGQFTSAGVVGLFLGALVLFRARRDAAAGMLVLWFFTGPFFAWLSNLSFDAQSDGILERFYILPALMSVFGAGALWDAVRRRIGRGVWLAVLAPAFLLARAAGAYPLRGDLLVDDYSRGVQRTLPSETAFFMDGGDDTFYSMAYRRYALRQRADVRYFDRGGLIFRSAYGPDFRSLTPAAKEERRAVIEHFWRGRGPLVYSTMNEKILPGAVLRPRGFLCEVENSAPPADLWPFYVFRALYPPASADYRTRALAPYFPFMKARALWRRGDRAEALRHLVRARRLGGRVPWLEANLAAQYGEFAFDRLRERDWEGAEALYRECLRQDPRRTDALVNLGAIGEQRGDLAAARRWYENALAVDPDSENALYNMAVLAWRAEDWGTVVPLFEKVLAINPAREDAARYLAVARRKSGAAGGAAP